MIFRQAVSGDIPGMVRLLGHLFSIEEDFHFNPDVHAKALDLIIKRCGKETLVLVAVLENPADSQRILGMMTLQTVVSTATGSLSGWIEDVVIDPGYRGKGIGSALLSKAEKWAESQGISRLQLLADRSNQKALDFYESKGWTAGNMVHRKKMILS